MALATNLLLKVDANLSKSRDLASASYPSGLTVRQTLTSGTSAGQADLLFDDTRTLASEATEDLDLAGSLTDAFGDAVVFAKVKAVIITAASGNTNNVVVGGTNNVPLFGDTSDTISIKPGGAFMLYADGGYAVTASTGDLLTIANSSSGSSVTYSILVIGTSA